MSDYDTIKNKMLDYTQKWAIQVDYPVGSATPTTRKFVSLLIGSNPGPNNDVVLCFQYEGTSPTDTGYRCYNIAKFVSVTPILLPPGTIAAGKKMTFKDVKKQSSVEDVDDWRRRPY